MECAKCNKGLSKNGSHFQCQACFGTFHRGCIKGLLADIRAGICRTHCNNCETDSRTDDDEQDEIKKDFEKILKDIQKKVSGIPTLRSQLESISSSMSMLSDKYDILIAEHEQSKQKITELKKNVTNINNKIIYLEKCNSALEQKVQEYDQASRKNNLEIVGVEQLPEENLREVVTKTGQLINVSSTEIDWVSRRRQQRTDSGKPAPILIGFKATNSGAKERDTWIAQRRNLKEFTSDVITGGTMQNKVFINEDLTKAAKELLWNTKKRMHGLWKYVWVSNGKILAKKNDGDKAVWVRAESDLEEIIKK